MDYHNEFRKGKWCDKSPEESETDAKEVPYDYKSQ